MKKVFFTQRLFAYLIDFFVVYFVLLIFSSIFSAILPANEKEDKAYDSFLNSYQEMLLNPTEDKADKFLSEQSENMYIIEKGTVPVLLFGVIINLAYCGAFQYMNNGQTIGKKLLKIRIVSKDDKKKYTYLKSTLRAALNFGIFSNTILCIILIVLSSKTFLIPYYAVSIMAFLFRLVTVIMVAFKNDGRGLPDLICGTVVDKA